MNAIRCFHDLNKKVLEPFLDGLGFEHSVPRGSTYNFASHHVEIDVTFDNTRSLAVDVFLFFPSKELDNNPLELRDILSWQGVSIVAVQVNSGIQNLRSVINLIRNYFENCDRQVLLGDAQIVEEIKSFRGRANASQAKDRNQRKTISEAN